jgi:hypothetical protein
MRWRPRCAINTLPGWRMGDKTLKQRFLDSSFRDIELPQRDYYTFNPSEPCRLDSDDLRLIGEHLAPLAGKIKGFTLAQKRVGKDEAQALGKTLEKLPNLECLDLRYNNLGNEGLQSLLPSLARLSQLRDIKLRRNDISGEAGAKLLIQLMQSLPSLQNLELEYNTLGDAGLQTLAPYIAEDTKLYGLTLKDNGESAAGRSTLFTALGRNRHLAMVSAGNDQLSADEQRILHESLLHGDNKNVVMFLPGERELNTKLLQRHHWGRSKLALLGHDPTQLSYPELAEIHSLHGMLLYDYTRHGGYHARNIAAVDAHLDSLPPLPDTADGLFRADASGHAPLDNPRNWHRAAPIFELLCSKTGNLPDNILQQCTPKGVSFLDSALYAAPFEELLECLNAHGQQLNDKHLLIADGLPNHRLQHLIAFEEAPRLFTQENWRGRPAAAMRMVYDALPPEQQARVTNLHALTAQLRNDAPTSAKGR